jgi:hypothetical protein
VKKLLFVFSIMVFTVASNLSAQNNSKLPKGWYPWGTKPVEYEMGIDKSVFYNGKSSAYIKSAKSNLTGFGTLMQYISAENYIGKRLRLSGYIKSDKVESWSGMWMRIDGEKMKQLGFDNMQARPIKGTTDWKIYDVVLDIPEDSKGIGFGVLLDGKGKVWFDNMKIEEVDKTVPVTNMNEINNSLKNPVNLDFEE